MRVVLPLRAVDDGRPRQSPMPSLGPNRNQLVQAACDVGSGIAKMQRQLSRAMLSIKLLRYAQCLHPAEACAGRSGSRFDRLPEVVLGNTIFLCCKRDTASKLRVFTAQIARLPPGGRQKKTVI